MCNETDRNRTSEIRNQKQRIRGTGIGEQERVTGVASVQNNMHFNLRQKGNALFPKEFSVLQCFQRHFFF